MTRGVVEDRPAPQGAGPRPPLAVRMRPASLDEVVGQDHLLAPGARCAGSSRATAPSSVILYGPPGTGKTTLARLIPGATGRAFEQLSALNAGVKDVRGVIEAARRRRPRPNRPAHRAVHRRDPPVQPDPAGRPARRGGGPGRRSGRRDHREPVLLRRRRRCSRAAWSSACSPRRRGCVGTLVDRAVADERGLGGAVTLDADARAHLVRLAGGDARRASPRWRRPPDAVGPGRARSTWRCSNRPSTSAAVRYDRDGDQHYDVISAFIKSIRGSDADAALHYLARMIGGGGGRRGSSPGASSCTPARTSGWPTPPRCWPPPPPPRPCSSSGCPRRASTWPRPPIHLATAPKSNAVITAIDAAHADVRGRHGRRRPAASCATGTTRARRSSVTPAATATRTTTRRRRRPAVPARRAGRAATTTSRRGRGRAERPARPQRLAKLRARRSADAAPGSVQPQDLVRVPVRGRRGRPGCPEVADRRAHRGGRVRVAGAAARGPAAQARDARWTRRPCDPQDPRGDAAPLLVDAQGTLTR